jgi:hypothetical protein
MNSPCFDNIKNYRIKFPLHRLIQTDKCKNYRFKVLERIKSKLCRNYICKF